MCTAGTRKPRSCESLRRTPRCARAGRRSVLVHQRHQAVADFEAEQVDRLHVVPAELACSRGDGAGAAGRGFGARAARCLHSVQAAPPHSAADAEEHEVRHAGNQSHDAEQPAGHADSARGCRTAACAAPRPCPALRDMRVTMMRDRGREQQRRDLRDQAVADGEQRVGACRVGEQAQAVAERADGEAADDVDEEDQDAGDARRRARTCWRRPSSRRNPPRRAPRRGACAPRPG